MAAQFGGTHAEQLSHLVDATENSDNEDPTPFSHYIIQIYLFIYSESFLNIRHFWKQVVYTYKIR